MIGNVIDRRTNKHNVEIDAVFEPSCHDNSVEGATFFEPGYTWSFHQIYNTTVHDAIKWAEGKKEYTTVFLYDKGSRPAG